MGVDPMLKETVDPDPGFATKEVFFTWNPKNKSVYAIFPRYPDNRKLVLKGMQLPATGTEVVFLATKEKLKTENIGGNVVITLPEYNPNKIESDHAFAVKISGYGDFVAKPTVVVNYDPETAKPTVTLTTTTPGATLRYTTDGKEPVESSLPYTAPFSPPLAGTVKARAFKAGLLASKADSVEVKTFRTLPALNLLRPPEAGLRAELRSVDGGNYRAETVLRGYLEKADDVRSISLDPHCLENKCGMLWRGYIQVPNTGGYQFWLESDDGSILSIDGITVVDNDGDHGMLEKSGIVFLQKGWHSIRLVYFNSGGDAGLKLHYAPLGQAKRLIEPEMLGH